MGVLVSCFLNMTGNFKLGLALLITFSYPASSQRLFSRSRGNLLRQAAVARNAQLVEKDAAFDDLEQLTLGDSDRSSSFSDVARSSPVSESAAFLPVEPATTFRTNTPSQSVCNPPGAVFQLHAIVLKWCSDTISNQKPGTIRIVTSLIPVCCSR